MSWFRWRWLGAVLAVAAAAGAFAAEPLAQAGRIDLRGWNFEAQGSVPLAGDWAFTPGLREPGAPLDSAQLLRAPGDWNRALGGANGAGTYSLVLDCKPGEPLALLVSMQHSAALFYGNGQLLAAQGRPAADARDYSPESQPQRVVPLPPACPLRLDVQVANFDFARGGLVRGLRVGLPGQLARERENDAARYLVALGGVIVVSLLALAFFARRRQDRTPLYFGLFGLLFCINLGPAGQLPLPGAAQFLPFDAYGRLLFGSWYAGLALYALFVHRLFPRTLQVRVLQGLVAVCCAGIALAAVAPLSVTSATGLPLRWLAFLATLWMAWGLVRAWLAGQRGALLVLAALGCLALSVWHDVMLMQAPLHMSLLPYGMLGFVLAPAGLLVNRYARVLSSEEIRAVEQGARADLLVRATRAGFGDWDAVTDTVTYTDRFKEMLGWPADTDTSGWPSIFELMHPEDRDRAREQFRAMIRRRAPGAQVPGEAMSYRLRRRDGSYIWIHAEGISLADDSGRTRRFITSYLDVTSIREQEQALREQMELTRTEQRRLDLVVRGARVGIVDWDGQTHETYYSPRFREIRGYAPDADTSDWPDYFKVMIHPDDRDRVTKRWVKFIRGQGPEGPFGDYYAPEEYRLSRADGSHVWVQVSGVAVRDAQGFVLRWIAAIIDITERRAQEQQLQAHNEALEEAVRLREEVERIARHDIKTPLNSIVAVPRLLREERQLGAEADELLGIVERAGYRILSMVNLSLDLYKMEQGGYVFRPDAVDLADLAGKVVLDLRSHAASKRVRLQVDSVGAPYAWAEELLCYSLVANLLKNAVEASPEGGTVTVDIRAGGEGTVAMAIHNAGTVPEALRATFFRKYGTAGKASGTGLGTYSARMMARVQDGDIDMRTSETEGTTLTVRLRAAPEGKVPVTARHVAERREDHQPESVAAMAPKRVLLVDDDEYNLLIVRRFLPSPPFTVDTAINGKVALSAAQLQWPDIVFMDLDMPVMGGLEAVCAFRELERATLATRCTIVALSSHDDEDTRARARAAGFDRYLTKPVTREVIHNTLLELDTLIGDAGAPPAKPAPAAAPPAGMDDAVLADPDIEPILADFMASRGELVAQLLRAIAAEDRGEVRRLAHQLAGSFGLYGFQWASEQSRWLEKNFSDAVPADMEAAALRLRRHLQTVVVRYQSE